MTDDLVNELLTQVSILTDEKQMGEETILRLTQENLDKQNQLDKLHNEVADLRT